MQAGPCYRLMSRPVGSISFALHATLSCSLSRAGSFATTAFMESERRREYSPLSCSLLTTCTHTHRVTVQRQDYKLVPFVAMLFMALTNYHSIKMGLGGPLSVQSKCPGPPSGHGNTFIARLPSHLNLKFTAINPS